MHYMGGPFLFHKDDLTSLVLVSAIYLATIGLLFVILAFLPNTLFNSESLAHFEHYRWTTEPLTPDTLLNFHEMGPPIKYRVLFPVLLSGIWSSLPIRGVEGYFLSYIIIDAIFLFLASTILFLFLKKGHPPLFAAVGGIIFLLGFPIINGFSLFTGPLRSDVIGYVLLPLGLIAIYNQNRFFLAILLILAALTRESMLGILALSAIIGIHGGPIRKLLPLLPSVFAFIFVRQLIGWESYNFWWEPTVRAGGFNNFRAPLETLGFMWLTFHVFWILSFMEWRSYRRDSSGQARDPFEGLLIHVFPWIAPSLFIAIAIGAHFSETRILYELFPFVIGLGLFHLARIRERLKCYLLSPKRLLLTFLLSFAIIPGILVGAAVAVFYVARLTPLFPMYIQSLGLFANFTFLLSIPGVYLYLSLSVASVFFLFQVTSQSSRRDLPR